MRRAFGYAAATKIERNAADGLLVKLPGLQADVIAGPRATARRELRQVRKEATAAAPAVCRE